MATGTGARIIKSHNKYEGVNAERSVGHGKEDLWAVTVTMVCKMHATTTESPRAARRSSRLSGVGPELTLSEAKERIDSLSKRKK